MTITYKNLDMGLKESREGVIPARSRNWKKKKEKKKKKKKNDSDWDGDFDDNSNVEGSGGGSLAVVAYLSPVDMQYHFPASRPEMCSLASNVTNNENIAAMRDRKPFTEWHHLRWLMKSGSAGNWMP